METEANSKSPTDSNAWSRQHERERVHNKGQEDATKWTAWCKTPTTCVNCKLLNRNSQQQIHKGEGKQTPNCIHPKQTRHSANCGAKHISPLIQNAHMIQVTPWYPKNPKKIRYARAHTSWPRRSSIQYCTRSGQCRTLMYPYGQCQTTGFGS